MLIFEKFFFLQSKNFNSQELNRASVGTFALLLRIPRKNYGRRCVELVRSGDK